MVLFSLPSIFSCPSPCTWLPRPVLHNQKRCCTCWWWCFPSSWCWWWRCWNYSRSLNSALIPRDLLLLVTMVAVHILFQVSPILLNEVFEPRWLLFKQGPMVGVQALLWYQDLQAEVELFKLFQIVFHTRLDHTTATTMTPGSWSNCACPRRSPFVTQPPGHTHTEVDFVWIMSSTHNYYDHFGPDFPEFMIIMHVQNMHNLHNMQARAGYARAKGRKLIAGKKLWRVFEL